MIVCFFIIKIFSSLVSKIENEDLVEKTCEMLENIDLDDPIFIIDNSLELKKVNVFLTIKEELLEIKVFKNSNTKSISESFNFSNLIHVIKRALLKLDLPDNYDLFIDVSPKNKSFMRNLEIEILESFLIRNLDLEGNVIIRPLNCPLKTFLHDDHAYVNFYKINKSVYLLNTSVILMNDKVGSIKDLNDQESKSIIALMKSKIDIDSILDLKYKFDHKEFPVLTYSIYNAIMSIPSFYSMCAASTEFQAFMDSDFVKPSVDSNIIEYQPSVDNNLIESQLFMDNDLVESQLFINCTVRERLVNLESMRVKENDFFDKLDDICKVILLKMRKIFRYQFYNAVDKALSEKSLKKDLYVFYMRVHEALRFRIQLYIYMINSKSYINPIKDGVLRFYNSELLERDIQIIKERNVNVTSGKFNGYSYSKEMLVFLKQLTKLEE